jgi:hypothetical protein
MKENTQNFDSEHRPAQPVNCGAIAKTDRVLELTVVLIAGCHGLQPNAFSFSTLLAAIPAAGAPSRPRPARARPRGRGPSVFRRERDDQPPGRVRHSPAAQGRAEGVRRNAVQVCGRVELYARRVRAMRRGGRRTAVLWS